MDDMMHSLIKNPDPTFWIPHHPNPKGSLASSPHELAPREYYMRGCKTESGDATSTRWKTKPGVSALRSTPVTRRRKVCTRPNQITAPGELGNYVN